MSLKQNKHVRKKALCCVAIALVAVFGLWFLHNLAEHGRLAADARETARQSDVIREVFAMASVPAAQGVMGNEDIVAHIAVPGTAICYAVVQGADNEFYLDHDLLRQPNSNGSIFLDYLNCPDFTDRSTIIYGHNRRDGSMFHDLQLFKDREFFEDNDRVMVTTIDGELRYEVFAVFMAHMSFNYIQVDFADDDAFLALVYEIKDRAMHTRDISITGCDRILILSTCTGAGSTGRLAVVSRLITD